MKVKIIGLVAILSIAFSLTNTAVAQESRSYKIALEECFWGLILPNEDQRGLSLGLNVVSGALGLYAYTSATASADTFCSTKTASTAAFINDSYPTLVEDTARGEGQHLTAVLQLAGCDSTGQAAVIPLIRGDMAEALTAPGYDASLYIDKVHTMYKSVNTHAASACNIG